MQTVQRQNRANDEKPTLTYESQCSMKSRQAYEGDNCVHAAEPHPVGEPKLKVEKYAGTFDIGAGKPLFAGL